MVGNPSPKRKRLATLAKKTAEQKSAALEQLAKCCVVQLACERTGIGRSTYYKWLSEDEEFRELADKAIVAGRAYLNDVAFSGFLKKIQEGNVTMLIFWLKNNHPWFAERIRHEHQHEHHLADRELPPEEREELARAFRLSGMAGSIAVSEEMRKRFLESKEAVTPEDRVSDWGTDAPQKRMVEEVRRGGVKIEEILKRLKKKGEISSDRE
jgi:hypothetical protein